MNRAVLLSSFLMLAACGGGGGGGSGPSSVSTPAVTPAANCDPQPVVGTARNDGLRIANVQWLQVVGQDDDANTLLRGDKPARLRVDLLASSSRNAPARRELRIEDPKTGNCTLVSLSGPARVPTTLDVSTLANSYTVDVPAGDMQPGARFYLYMDDASGRSGGELAQVTRTLAPDIARPANETLFVIPIRFSGSNGYAPANTGTLSRLLTRLHPLSSLTVNTASAFTPPSALRAGEVAAASNGGQYSGSLIDMQNLLNEVDDRCQSLIGGSSRAATAPKCLGVFPDNLSFRPTPASNSLYTGLAFVGGSTMITQSLSQVDQTSVSSAYQASHWLTDRALTVAHEFGHLLDLDHAACGGATGLDLRLYLDGRLGGGNGYDVERNFYFSSSGRNSEFADLMSYCGKEWSSDRGYIASLNYRTPPAGAARMTAASTQWMKLTPTAGGWRLQPVSFAPATLVDSGETLSVDSERGNEQLPLRQAVISDSAGSNSRAPRYIDLGDRQLTRLALPATDALPGAVWTAADWLRTGG